MTAAVIAVKNHVSCVLCFVFFSPRPLILYHKRSESAFTAVLRCSFVIGDALKNG